MSRITLLIRVLLIATASISGVARGEHALNVMEASIPKRPVDCTNLRAAEIRKAAAAIEEWSANLTWKNEQRTAVQILDSVRQLVDAKQRVDQCLDEVLKLRASFVAGKDTEQGRETIRQFLTMTSQLIDLSGRMRYLLRDAIDEATYELTLFPKELEEMLDQLIRDRVSIGAMVMSYALFDPSPESGVRPFPIELKRKVLRLISATKETELLADLAELLREESISDSFRIEIAKVIREIGLPQDPYPGQQDATVEITARQLHDNLLLIDARKLTADQRTDLKDLHRWLALRIRFGIRDDVFRFGDLELKPGDWLLMRNPSPYNMFTDLAPGLFTHVGVVSTATDDKGLRRFVIVDLPERGDRIPAMTVEEYLKRTLHYFFLRHQVEKVQTQLGNAAAAMIGNETQFDLTFKTQRVLELKDKPLKGQRINTYCAGFLLLCAQATGEPRTQFFPIPEYRVGGHCGENFAKLGISFGEDFVSPTGAIFSPSLEIVSRREAMYSPPREVKEAIYDHFAKVMVEKKLTPSPTTYQALREKVAGLSKYNPWLAKTLAKVNNVSEHMDLQAAAKTSAVIETLDEIADSNRDEFLAASQAITAGPEEELAKLGVNGEQMNEIRKHRERHARLFSTWIEGQISPRELRIDLVKYYSELGQKTIEDRFFGE